MDVSSQIEQLSFGRTIPRIESCLGLYLSPDAMFLSEVSFASKPKVLHLLRLPIPGGEETKQTRTGGTLNTDFLKENKSLLGILQKALGGLKWSSKHVVVSLSHHFGILRYFTLPEIDRRFWKTAVPVEAKKYIPIPFTQLVHDFQVRSVPPGPDGRSRIGSLFGVTHQSNLAAIQALTDAAGLVLIGTELAPCSVERLWGAIDPAGSNEPYAHVHFDGGHARIVVSELGIPIFYREVFLQDNPSPSDRRKVDLPGCVDFAKKTLGAAEISKVRLSGKLVNPEEWCRAFSEDAGKPAVLQKTDELIGIKGGEWGGYASIGSALRHLASSGITLDLSSVGKISEEDRRTARNLIVGASILGAWFLTLGLFQHGMSSVHQKKLSSLNTDAQVSAAFQGKTLEEIDRMISEMRDKVNSFGALTSQQVPLTEIFEVLAESIPEQVWLDTIEYDNPISLQGAKSIRTLLLKGAVSTGSRAEEQDIGQAFATKLREQKRISESFPEMKPGFEAPRADSSGRGGVDSSAQPTVVTIRFASGRER